MTLHGPVALVRSSRAGHGGNLDPVAVLAAFGLRVAEHVEADALGDTPALGKAWRARGLDAVIAAGGDGTVGCATTAALESGLPLGILPAGTANDVARSLRLPLRLDAAAAALAGGRAAEIDAGQVIPAAHGASVAAAEEQAAVGGAEGPFFLHLVAIGAKATFARLATDPVERGRWGRLTYPVAFLRSLLRCRGVSVTLRMAGATDAESPREVTCSALQVLIANTAVLGGALNLRLPDVDENDRLLNVIVVEAPAWRASTFSRRAEQRAPLLLPRIRRYAVRAVVLDTPESQDVTVDGEIRMRTPVLVRIAERRVAVLLPVGSRHGARTSARPRASAPTEDAALSGEDGDTGERGADAGGDERV